MNDEKKRILIVDDERFNINILVDLLKNDYKTMVAKNGEQALLRAACATPPDLILLDVMMPGMDGYEVCRQLKENPLTTEIPVIFVTAMNDVEDEASGLAIGAGDYITKPVSPPIVKARVKTQLMLKEAHEFLLNQNHILEEKVRERTRELALTQDVTIYSLTSLAETRDNETGNHIRRTQHYVRLLAVNLAKKEKYQKLLTPDEIEIIYKSAPLHDIGKVGVPDSILLKPGKLTDEEFAEMRNHARYGRDALLKAEEQFGSSTEFLTTAKNIAYSHHEKWDGSGYPEGISGENIPLSARLMAVADVYDALANKRCYKSPFPHHKVLKIIKVGSASHFDPDVVEALMEIEQDFLYIVLNYCEDAEQRQVILGDLPEPRPSESVRLLCQ